MDILETITAERAAAEAFEADRKAMGQKVCPSCGRVGLIWKVKREANLIFRSPEAEPAVDQNVQYATCQQCWWQDLKTARRIA